MRPPSMTLSWVSYAAAAWQSISDVPQFRRGRYAVPLCASIWPKSADGSSSAPLPSALAAEIIAQIGFVSSIRLCDSASAAQGAIQLRRTQLRNPRREPRFQSRQPHRPYGEDKRPGPSNSRQAAPRIQILFFRMRLPVPQSPDRRISTRIRQARLVSDVRAAVSL